MMEGTNTGQVDLVALTRSYGSSVAVDGIDLRIESGEFISLLGPSGCGKTTTLRMIAGFERPTSGQIFLDGMDLSERPPHQRNVHTVFQNYALFPHLNVVDNIAFGLRRRKLGKREVQARVRESLELVQLHDRGRARPAELSGGQQQRVALARALVNRPAVLLLDEPLAALDLKLRRQMQVDLKRIQREVGITFVFVTHDQEEALTLSDRIVVMNEGRIQQCGAPEEIYERPEKPFVAGFIGVSNLIEGVVETDGVRLRTGALVPASRSGACDVGDAVHLSVRPEKIHINDLADGMVAIDGELRDIIYLGTTTQYVVEVGQGAVLIALEQNVHRAGAHARPAKGSRMRLGWHPENSLVLRASA